MRLNHHHKILICAIFGCSALALFFAVATLFSSFYASAANEGYPEIRFITSPIYDFTTCLPGSRRFMDAEFDRVFANEMSLLQRLWDDEGGKFLRATVKLLKRKFPGQKRNVYLHRCYLHYGWSSPTLLPGYLLLIEQPDDFRSQLRREQLADLTFYELLHPLVLRILMERFGTPLLKKYGNESLVALFHLHLFAVQKAIYLQYGEADRWERLKKRERKTLPGYSRAIEIVEAEGYDKFVDELSQSGG